MRQTQLVGRTPGGGFTVRLTGSRSAPPHGVGAPLRTIQAAGHPPRVSRAQLDAIDGVSIPVQRDADHYPVMPDPTLAAVQRLERERVMGNRATAQPTTPDNVLDEYYPRDWLPEVWADQADPGIFREG